LTPSQPSVQITSCNLVRCFRTEPIQLVCQRTLLSTLLAREI